MISHHNFCCHPIIMNISLLNASILLRKHLIPKTILIYLPRAPTFEYLLVTLSFLINDMVNLLINEKNPVYKKKNKKKYTRRNL
ncbi:hypothetical protein RhiirA5_55638 [Rhizophagus irregularis]|uniref:Uncharacterized protein n=2 Tax=Rhizophagus irregularis TaxID=588596 RepID=A0A2N0P2Z0_9GLOM|nr:hypothetical protein RhiirA5_55638 [Rhizophagus irregularis]